jgi:DNA polymerase elongation subunit (family B)
MDVTFRLLDFHIVDELALPLRRGKDNKRFVIQMFGKDARGKSYSLLVKGFTPFFYVKVGDSWDRGARERFMRHIQRLLKSNELHRKYNDWKTGRRVYPEPFKTEGAEEFVQRVWKTQNSYYKDSITECKIIQRKKLYGFDNCKQHKFVLFRFRSTAAFNKFKGLWYESVEDATSRYGRRRRLRTVPFENVETELYEAKLPPLLRYFHISEISPCGWITVKRSKLRDQKSRLTHCDYEYITTHSAVTSLPDKETPVPLTICSFDIEASSSHGDFPQAKKTYEKLAKDIINYWSTHSQEVRTLDAGEREEIFCSALMTAFGFEDGLENINPVYPKVPPSYDHVKDIARRLWTGRMARWSADDILCDDLIDTAKRIERLDIIMKLSLPPLEGDKTTFIGSTFRREGEEEPYLNHCVVLGTCEDIPNADVEEYETEETLLIGWRDLVQREQPDVIIGYNIFGFDWSFLRDRADENDILPEFSCMGRNKGSVCRFEKKVINIASGTHELVYLDMEGRLQIDLYNYFRREVNLASYKLDSVASHFIGDSVGAVEELSGTTTRIRGGNLMGLQVGNFVRFEVIGHSTDEFEGGRKWRVLGVEGAAGTFDVEGCVRPESGQHLRWSLGKDDVGPQDIFRLTNGSAADRATVGKYCIMDCRLVDLLAAKNDILETIRAVADICSIPLSFVVLRGQGIKLLSFIARECRSKGTLMPVVERPWNDGGYEGAICLPPKRGLHQEPVAVVDFASLYPSSMISENISHDSKCTTKEYNLRGELVRSTGDAQYDDLEGYSYVDIEYDRYEWVRTGGSTKKVKVKVGTKICRFAQFPGNKKAIMPSIAQELLAARKATRAKIKYKTLELADGTTRSGIVKTVDDSYTVTTMSLRDGAVETAVCKIPSCQVTSVRDTYDEFMKNVFDKRQLGLKITANSLYGQCGAATSAFCDKDIAASVTATGRKLLVYAKTAIERIYRNRRCLTTHGPVTATAEVVYGDTDSAFFKFHILDSEGSAVAGKTALEMTITLARQAGALVTKFLKLPHDLEYEKTFWPFLLLSKKRYVGTKYEYDPDKGKRSFMGIVLKRRDNAPIVKDIYGGIIDRLLASGGAEEAVVFAKQFLEDIVAGRFPLRKLVISKALRGFYKNRRSIAHAVLADRMAKRDPGNKPAIGSRIPFAYIEIDDKKALQGDRIETPEYIRRNGCHLDYKFYITNQIMKPVTQVFGLVLEDIPAFSRRLRSFKTKLDYVRREHSGDKAKMARKEERLRSGEVKRLVFADALRRAENARAGQRTVESFFCS